MEHPSVQRQLHTLVLGGEIEENPSIPGPADNTSPGKLPCTGAETLSQVTFLAAGLKAWLCLAASPSLDCCG